MRGWMFIDKAVGWSFGSLPTFGGDRFSMSRDASRSQRQLPHLPPPLPRPLQWPNVSKIIVLLSLKLFAQLWYEYRWYVEDHQVRSFSALLLPTFHLECRTKGINSRSPSHRLSPHMRLWHFRRQIHAVT
ncbi:hypothetical protein LIA77_03669 [Sarocladium implicatum]|nr:hypothetical protein LIA77_03669 [Sarocladium implicatum]